MKGQLKNIEGVWTVIPDWYYKDIIKESSYPVHPKEDVSNEKERTCKFEIVKYKGREVALLNISFTKPGFVEKRISQMKNINGQSS